MDYKGSNATNSAQQPPRRDTNPEKQKDDDPVRFSSVFRMFEAKSAPPKIEKGVTTTRPPPPTNRLKPKKVTVSTMTDPLADDEYDVNYDVNYDDIRCADNACGSSTFEQQQQTDMDDDWLRRDNLNGSTNGKTLNPVTSDRPTNGCFERSGFEGDDRSADGATSQWGRAADGKVTSKIPGTTERYEPSLSSQYAKAVSINSQAAPIASEYAKDSHGAPLTSKHTKAASINSQGAPLAYEIVNDTYINSQGAPLNSKCTKEAASINSHGAPLAYEIVNDTYINSQEAPLTSKYTKEAASIKSRGAPMASEYVNDASLNSQGSPLSTHGLSTHGQKGTRNSGVTESTFKNDSMSVSVTAIPVPSEQYGVTAGLQDDRNQCSETRVQFKDKSGRSCDQADGLHSGPTGTKSDQLKTVNLQLEEDFGQPRMATGSHTGKASNSGPSRTSYESVELYEKVVQPGRHQGVEAVSSDSDQELYEDVLVPRRTQWDQVPPGSNKEQGKEKQAVSSTSTEIGQRDPDTRSSTQSTDADHSSSRVVSGGGGGGGGTVEYREVNKTRNATAGGSAAQVEPHESSMRSMATSTYGTAVTDHVTTKTSGVEFECQTEPNDDIYRSSRNVRDQSTDPEEDSLDKYFWYFGDADRDLAEVILEDMMNESGSYLVRMSQRGGDGNPYTLSVVFQRRVYHLLIRQRSDGKFSIGKQKFEEKCFFTVQDLITFYRNNFVELIADPGKKTPSGKIQLKNCPPK